MPEDHRPGTFDAATPNGPWWCAMSLLSNQSVSAGRILVVDDDQSTRDLMVSSLRAADHDMDPTGNGPEARRLLGTAVVRPDRVEPKDARARRAEPLLGSHSRLAARTRARPLRFCVGRHLRI